jgi:hypothetical protein
MAVTEEERLVGQLITIDSLKREEQKQKTA